MVTRIVVPLDGSQISHAALPVARTLAEMTGAGVTLVSVIDPPRDFYFTSQDASTTRLRPKDIDHLASEEIRLQEYLDQLKHSFEGARVNTDIRLGGAADEILRVAESIPGSAIVMASHGRSGLGSVFIGSVTNRVVQGANMPVFVIRASSDTASEFGKQKINHLAVALDGSQIAEQALRHAYDIFGNDVRYTLMRIVEPVASGQAFTSESIVFYEREAREFAEDYLATRSEELVANGATVSADVRVMQPAEGITQIASEFGADLIVTSTHGRSGFGRFLMGSVAERVLRESDRPLMIVRGVEPDEPVEPDA